MEIIRLSTETADSHWTPVVTKRALSVVDDLDRRSQDRILEEASNLLKNCGDPNEQSSDVTGLAIGYVQSGKTLSFTTVTALAADNGFDIVIILAGMTTSLVDQTFGRLKSDLSPQKGVRNYESELRFYKNPNREQGKEISKIINSPLAHRTKRKCAVAVVMKNITHLKRLRKSLDELSSEHLKTPRVLIIDDEGDQASHNTKAKRNLKLSQELGIEYGELEEFSAIYNELRLMRQALQHHSFVQYTATPQAPLLISLFDILSPDFVQLLTPGESYTGGQTFFREKKIQLIRSIPPEEEVNTKRNSENGINESTLEMPHTLKEALYFFFITVAIGRLEEEHYPPDPNRTMMVHPSHLTKFHKKYFRWITSFKRSIERNLESEGWDRELILSEFNRMYKSELLQSTTFSFSEIEPILYEAITETRVIQTNSTSIDEGIDWDIYSNILVGGNILDRGFTVEGLNVSYMPRQINDGSNADTIQQRCRFFGYKASYIDMCRVYISRRSNNQYTDYVDHEEHFRSILKSHKGDLKQFKRVFILNSSINATRSSVLGQEILKTRFSKGPLWLSKIDPLQDQINDQIDAFVKTLGEKLKTSSFSGESPKQKIKACEMSVREVMEHLILELDYHIPENIRIISEITALLSAMGDKPILVLQMPTPRERTAREGAFANIFQGSNLGTNYKGDRECRSEKLYTLQIHRINVKKTNQVVCTLALFSPKGKSLSIVSHK